MPEDYIVPNFQNQTVSQVGSTLPSGITVKVKEPGDDGFHEPSGTELSSTVTQNGPNSQPGSTKTNGEWVGVVINPV